jgi:hypothetical protein
MLLSSCGQLLDEERELPMEPKPPRLEDVVEKLLEGLDIGREMVATDVRAAPVDHPPPPRKVVGRRFGNTISAITLPATRPIVRPEPVE